MSLRKKILSVKPYPNSTTFTKGQLLKMTSKLGRYYTMQTGHDTAFRSKNESLSSISTQSDAGNEILMQFQSRYDTPTTGFVFIPRVDILASTIFLVPSSRFFWLEDDTGSTRG